MGKELEGWEGGVFDGGGGGGVGEAKHLGGGRVQTFRIYELAYRSLSSRG